MHPMPPTGIEMYYAVKKAARAIADAWTRPAFEIHKCDATHLLKLTPLDFVELGYDRSIADRVSYALFHADFEPLGQMMGIRFVSEFGIRRLAV